MPDNPTTEEDYLPEIRREFDSLLSRLLALIAEVEEKMNREEAPVQDIIADGFLSETPDVLTQYHPDEREPAAFVFGLPVFGPDAFDMAKVEQDPQHYASTCEWSFRLAKAYLQASDGAQWFLHLAAIAAVRYTKGKP